MDADWLPTLDDQPGPLYERLLRALQADLRSGVVGGGTRLPPQRILAHRLGLSVGTVTKAYVEAERRGLVTGQVGRGTYVAHTHDEPASVDIERVIDLSRNVVPLQEASGRLIDTLSALRRRPDLLTTLDYGPPAGLERHRRAASAWLEWIAHVSLPWERLVITVGAQQGIWLALSAVCGPGDTIICESATYFGVKTIAELNGYQLAGVEMDDQGVLPAALEAAVERTGAGVLYLMPTRQNPTAATMGADRRAAIVEIARRRRLWIVEDDSYALFTPDPSLVPLAALAPDRCFYVNAASKCLSPGLRVGFLACPDDRLLEVVLKAVRASVYTPPGLGALVFASWVEDGSGRQIAEAALAEVGRRAAIAAEALGVDAGGSPHLWLPMPELEAERAAGRALRAGVRLTAPEAPMVEGGGGAGLRVCLGTPAHLHELRVGLGRLKSALNADSERAEMTAV